MYEDKRLLELSAALSCSHCLLVVVSFAVLKNSETGSNDSPKSRCCSCSGRQGVWRSVKVIQL